VRRQSLMHSASRAGDPYVPPSDTVKRAMAGEYSRELSAKVFQGQCRLIELGYRQGGPASFGLRRLLLDEKGESKGELRFGEKKSIQTDRVILVPGPAEEIAVVERVYRLFLDERRTESTNSSACRPTGPSGKPSGRRSSWRGGVKGGSKTTSC
jgi:hypothetical protein